MLIFLAGAHGVGKTFLGKPVAESLGIRHATASTLIREEMGSSNWDADKRVMDSAANQEALIAAVARISSSEPHLIIDGHFVLRDVEGNLDPLPATVFSRLGLGAVVLIEAPADVVLRRLGDRGASQTLHSIEELAYAEFRHGEYVCRQLGLPFYRLILPNEQELQDVVAHCIADLKRKS